MCARDRIQDQEGVVGGNQRQQKPSFAYSGRGLRYLKLKHNIQNVESVENQKTKVYQADWMSKSTTYSRQGLQIAQQLYEKFKSSRYFRYMPKAKTVRHAFMIAALSIILMTFINKHNEGPRMERNKAWTFVYLLTVAMHFGVQIWMTLVSGLVLYFNLPRHVFGQVQQNLFPAYYAHCSVLSFLTVISFIQAQSEIRILSKEFCQLLALSLTFVIELAVKLYISKAIVMLKHVKTRMEAAAGTGQEVGSHVLGELAFCPHYMKILKKFRLLHSYTAVGTILTVLCSVYHLNYLSEKICF